jgi:hypothetical protein
VSCMNHLGPIARYEAASRFLKNGANEANPVNLAVGWRGENPRMETNEANPAILAVEEAR